MPYFCQLCLKLSHKIQTNPFRMFISVQKCIEFHLPPYEIPQPCSPYCIFCSLYSFAAGTTDGPGEFDFTQGANTSNPFWDFVSGLLKDPSPEQEACHAPKPILLDTGEVI